VRSAVSADVTGLLRAWSQGDAGAAEKLVPLVYDELKRQAARYMRRERRDHTLRPTALVHEAYLRLVGQDRVAWKSRAQFFGVAAQVMRRVLVDHARPTVTREWRITRAWLYRRLRRGNVGATAPGTGPPA
jgi:RNA polymerase sigma factor (TIGR02999 family)